MDIGILSRNKELYSTRKLINTARDMGHHVHFMNTLKCSLVIDKGDFRVLYGERDMSDLDVVLTRIGTTVTEYGLAVAQHFESIGVTVINSHESILNSRDKFRSLQIMQKNRIPTPKTVLARSPDAVFQAIRLVGGTPVILKMNQGTQGAGVMFADSLETVESVLEALWDLGANIQIQKFVAESRGRDLRAFVIGGKVVAAMRRIAAGTSFRSNIHQGGHGEPVDLEREQERLALKTARVLGLKIAGIDMLESSAGPVVIEANSSPGFEGLERATGKDIARAMIEYIVSQARR
ncbi:MAG TPA: RimK family alpha-L-glutamate ligase [Candidatus Thermoplasmatota archaeon]